MVVRSVSPTQVHAGIAYRADDRIRIVDLQWYNAPLGNSDFDKFSWVEPAIDELNAGPLATLCGVLVSRYGASLRSRANCEILPYGFRYDGGKFTEDGTILLEGNAVGLTCATFVLAAFEYIGVR